jgi:hypothetical protein
MDKHLKIVIAGTAIAAAISTTCAIANNIKTAQHDQHIVMLGTAVEDLKTKCMKESEANQAKYHQGYGHDPLVCDPDELKSMDSGGIHKELEDAQKAVDAERYQNPIEWPYVLSAVILITSMLPWCWYFLIRRIRELSDAIRGK